MHLNLLKNTGKVCKIQKFYLKKFRKIVLNCKKIVQQNNKNLESITSPIELNNALIQLRSKFNNLDCKILFIALQTLKKKWIKKINKQFMCNSFKHSKKYKTWHFGSLNQQNLKLYRIIDLKNKIIKKGLFNYLEQVFKGSWFWVKKFKITLNGFNQKYALHDKKIWAEYSIHSTLRTVKHWKKKITWAFTAKIRTEYVSINKKYFSNIFLHYLPKLSIWKKILKMFDTKIINFQKLQNDALSLLFFNLYLNKLDIFLNQLNKNKLNWKTVYPYKRKVSCNLLEYVRHWNNLLIGFNTPQKIALTLYKQINQFIQVYLNLKVKHSNKIFDVTKNNILFFGFNICFSEKYIKSKLKLKYFKHKTKPRKLIIKQIRKCDTKLAKVTLHLIKINIIKAFCVNHLKKIKIFDKENTIRIANTLAKKITLKKAKLYKNKWKHYFNILFSKKIFLSLVLYQKQFKNSNFWVTNNKINLKHNSLTKLKKVKMGTLRKFYKKYFLLDRDRNLLFDNRKVNLIKLPSLKLFSWLKTKGFYHIRKKKPIVNILLINLNYNDIINCYSKIINKIINHYRIVDNFWEVKNFVKNLKQSCYKTLAYKHKKSVLWINKIYTQNAQINLLSDKMFALLNIVYSINLNRKFITFENYNFNFDNLINKYQFQNKSNL